MPFLSPWFLLAGLAAIALPVWLHLLKQHKITPLQFPSIELFEARTQSSVKHRRLKYLLLFALRCALLALLAFAFAKPYRELPPGAVAKEKMIVYAVDHSFSMRQGDRLTRAKEEATRMAGQLKSPDRARVLALSSNAAMISDATADTAAVKTAIASIEPGDGRGSFSDLARVLRGVAESSRLPVEAHLYSDMQKSSWPANFTDTQLGPGVTLEVHPVATARVANFAVERVNAPKRVYDTKKARVQATITSFGAPASTKKVSLAVGGRELQSKSVDIQAGGRATVEFIGLDVGYGLTRAEVKITPADEFAADDTFAFAVERSDPRRVLFVHDGRAGQRGLNYFRTALDASGEGAFAIDVVTPEMAAPAGLAKYALVVLSDVPSLGETARTAISRWVREGGSVWIAQPRGSDRVPVFDEAVAETRYSTREGERFRTVASVDTLHPALRSSGKLAAVKFYQTLRVTPGSAKVLATLTDGTPILLEKAIGEGRAILFTSGFENLTNDFPLHPTFVPFVAETTRYLARLDDGGAAHTVGSFFELRTSKDLGAAIEVIGPDGQRALSLGDAAKVQSLPLPSAGYYDVRRPNGRHELVAVNPDRQESDLDVLPAETIALWKNTGQGGVAAAIAAGVEQEKRTETYWWWVMALALVAALAESVVGNRHLAREQQVGGAA